MSLPLRLTIILIFCIGSLKSIGQKRFSLSVGIENRFPLKPFKYYYKNGFGVSSEVDYKILKRVKIFFNASYIKYSFNSENLDVTGDEAFLPIELGGKFYLSPKLYLMAGGGVNLDFGNVITPYHVYHVGFGVEFLKHLSADLKYERTGMFDFTPKVIKLGLAYNLGSQ